MTVKKMTTNKKDFIVFGAFCCLNLFLTPIILVKAGHLSAKAIVCACAIEALFDSIMAAWLYRTKDKKVKIEKRFFVMSIFFGLLIIAFIPTGQSPDEYAHTTRAWGISSGDIVSKLDESGTPYVELPVEFKDYRESDNGNKNYFQLAEKLRTGYSGEKFNETRHYPAAASYNPILYIPQVFGLLVGRILHLPLVYTLYLGRIFALLAYSVIVYYAIKMVPFWKKFMFVFALLPITMQQAASFSADSVTIAVSFFAIAYLLRLIFSNKKLDKKNYLALIGLSALLAVCKTAYLPLMSLILLIRKDAFGKTSRKIILCAIAVIAALTAYGAWSLLLPDSAGSSTAGEQLAFAMHSPIKFLGILAGSFIESNLDLYLAGALGMHLGFFNINSPRIYFYIALLMIVSILMNDGEKVKVSVPMRALATTLFAGITFVIMATLFISWTKVGETVVDGVQGRYFIPFIMLLPMILHRKIGENRTPLSERTISIICFSFCLCACLCAFAINITAT